MSYLFSKLNNRSVIIITGLALFYLIIHMPLIEKTRNSKSGGEDFFKYFNVKNLEDRSIKVGDYTYYLHGVLSIFDFEIEKKFNDKHQPVIHQKGRIHKTDMSWYAKYVLIFYPYPSFKFGYSLTAAFMTGLVPDELFHYHIHRLIFVNIILIILTIVLIFLIVKRLTNSDIVAIIPCLFFIFDVSNAHNSYSQSHTISGIFYLMLCYYLFIKSKEITPLRLGVIAFLLVFCVLSSTHIIPLAFFMGLFIYLSVCYKENKLKIFKYTLACIIGISILPLYIIGVEKLFHFQELGLPITLAQLNQMHSTINLMMKPYPIHLRFIWDLRLFNIFIVPGLVITLSIIIYQKYASRNSEVSESKLPFLAKIKKNVIDHKNYYIMLLTIILATIITSVYTLPVSRAMTSYTILWGMVLGIFLGKRFVIGNKIVKGLVGIIILMIFLNFYLMFKIIKLPDNKPSNNIIVLDEREIIQKNMYEMLKSGKTNLYKFKMISLSIRDFIKKYDAIIKDKTNTYIQFDPMDFTMCYALTHELKIMMKEENYSATQKKYVTDFRLITEVFNLYSKKLLSDSDIIRRRKIIWDFSLWNGIYTYIYGYMNYVKKYLKGTSLELLNTHYIYYINYEALKNAFLKHPGEEK